MFHFTAGEPVADGVRAVAKDQLDRALRAIDDSTTAGSSPDTPLGDTSPEAVDRHHAVHEARKRCKKVRATLRLVRDDVPDTYDDNNTELRDIARLVSAERDAAAHVEAHDLLVERLGEEALAPYDEVRKMLVAYRDGPVLARIEEQLPEVRERLATVRWNVDGWDLPDGDAVAVLRAGYERTYGRARARWQQGTEDPTSDGWHEWRKRVKYNRYHTNLLQEAWPAPMELREDLLHDLTDHLGDDNDLWELRLVLTGEGEEASGAELDLDEATRTGYVGLLDGLRARVQHDALPLAARCYGQPVDEHARLVLAWWRLAVDEARAEVVDADELNPVITPGD